MVKSKFPIRHPPSRKSPIAVSGWGAAAEFERSSESAEKEPGTLWFRDPEKLLSAVVQHAISSPTFARDFVTAAGTLASAPHAKELRTALKAALMADAPKTPGRATKELWFCTMLENDYLVLREVHGMKSGDAYELVGKLRHLTASRVRQLVARSKAQWAAARKSTISKQDDLKQE